MGRFQIRTRIRTEGKSCFRKRDEMKVSSLKHAIGNASRNEFLPSQAQKLLGFMRIVRKVKEMKRWLRERMGVAMGEEGRKSRRRRQNPLQQHSSRTREREREKEREQDGCIPPWLFPPPSAAPVLSGMQPSRHIRNEF